MPRGLRREHVVAIRAYTKSSLSYCEFNAATRQYGANDAIYQEKFHFKSFHYLLSVALDKFKKKRLTTYRGSQELFIPAKEHYFRFGQFASSSLQDIEAKEFMKKFNENTLFKIVTKLGVRISQFSHLPAEHEVLIPPIEVFKVKHKPDWVEKHDRKWRKINLTANGCQGVTVNVQTRNGPASVTRSVACPSLARPAYLAELRARKRRKPGCHPAGAEAEPRMFPD
uniref:NAD(P)(+)--arginine ADP-ribosyltransferase 2-like n=1 Tax=Pristiophorus japonicus TaxID=55135 RepID=UPI00398E61DD